MRFVGILRNRVWGFRIIEVSAFAVLIVLALTVYLAKVGGARDAQAIANIEREIASERQRIRLLEAEVAHNEQPARIGQLSQDYLKLEPAAAEHEVTPETLVDIARGAKPEAKAVQP